ncbi:hypothetical protein BDB01DRAFT_19852 [Pilobolus umbonatus]|nr:hypothetical protein BDB01DRAFT_19852 [Pilobolus umbonatus]
MSNEDRTSKEPKKTTAKERGTKNEPNISQSSWIYRLTINGKQQGMERNDVCANEVSKEEGKSIVDIEINTSETPADTTPIQPVESTTHTQSNIPTQNSRIWSWLGYSSDPSTDQTNESTIPVIESTVNEQTDDTQEPLRVDQSKIPYWKSYFTSNNSIDSMNPINSSNDQQSQICTKTNAVIPTFRSQFTEPYREQLTLFTKAMNIVNSIFTGQKSNFYDIDFSSMVDTMKKHPDDLDGKRFVVIGVHGWFPMKVLQPIFIMYRMVYSFQMKIT